MHAALQPLEKEITTFENILPNLREQYPVGTYVLIAGCDLLGTFRSYAQALKAGYEKMGSDPFLVKQVSKEGEDVAHVYGLKA
jgi:hypothetical protein